MAISVGGIISGLDTESIITQLLTLEAKPIVNLQQKEADFQVELTAYGSLKSVLNSLKSAAEGLDTTSNLTGFSTTSGDTDIFTVSAGSSATEGSYDITVEKMAKAHKLKSADFATDTEEIVKFKIYAANNNNMIDFYEDGENDYTLVATLTDGDYTVSELEAEIKKQLEAASDGAGSSNNIDYTVSYDSATQKFTIKENGSSLTELQLLWDTGANGPAGTNTSAGAILGFNAADDIGATSYIGDTKMGEVFTVTASNNKINFKEIGGTGAELTATIAAGAYTIDDLETAVKSALDDAVDSAATYSASYNASTQKFTLSGSGGSVTEIQFLWGTGTDGLNGTDTSAASLLGFDAADDTGAVTYTSDNAVYKSTLHIEMGSTFTIGATNNTINFIENGGTGTGLELTATLDSGTYTISELEAEIKTQLDAATGSVATYTVSYDNSKEKFLISGTGNGVTEIQYLWNTGTDNAKSVASTLGFSTAANDTGLLAYTADNKVGDVTHLSISASDDIDDMADAINDADAGVTAAVIFDGTDYVLTLTGEDTGADNVISITATDPDGDNTGANGLSRLAEANLTEIDAAQDSQIKIDTITVTRATNTIDDVVEGVTITLKDVHAVPASESDTLTVSRKTSTAVSKINSFVSAYNKVLDFFEAYQGYNEETEIAGPLQGDATTNLIRNRLRSLTSQMITGVTSFSWLSDLGIELNDEGDLTTDSSTLNNALDDNFDDVLQFFTQTTEGAEGFAVRMVDALEGFLDKYDGTLTSRTSGIKSNIEDIEDDVERLTWKLEASEIRMRARFQALEMLLGQYQSTSDFLGRQITALQNLSSYISGL